MHSYTAPPLDASQCVSPACEQAASSPCVVAASAHLTPSAWRDIPSSWRRVAAAWQLVDIVRTNCWPSCTCLQPHRPLTPCLKAKEFMYMSSAVLLMVSYRVILSGLDEYSTGEIDRLTKTKQEIEISHFLLCS